MDDIDSYGLPLWPAPERNKQPILDELLSLVPTGTGTIVEISAATGQHAVHFAPHFPGYDYYVTDCEDSHCATLKSRLAVHKIPNLRGPLLLDTTKEEWPVLSATIIYNANMMHIAPWAASEGLFRGAGRILSNDGYLFTYGPYRISGEHTSVSNREFDDSLRKRNPAWGVRDIDELQIIAKKSGINLIERRQMPANNLFLIWQKQAPA